jgi:hypothetical protein
MPAAIDLNPFWRINTHVQGIGPLVTQLNTPFAYVHAHHTRFHQISILVLNLRYDLFSSPREGINTAAPSFLFFFLFYSFRIPLLT